MDPSKIVEEIIGPESAGSDSARHIRRIIISNPKNTAAVYKKIVALPVSLKDRQVLNFSCYAKDKVFHYNLTGEAVRAKLLEIAEMGYKQWEVKSSEGSFTLLVGKKGNYKRINLKNKESPAEYLASNPHNRVKNHVLKEGGPLELLINLGLMNKEGRIFKDKQRKFRQINKFLEIADTIAPYVENGSHILDFGCGKSYLTFALYHYFNVAEGKSVKITGLDLKEDVVAHCNQLAKQMGYENLVFLQGDAARFNEFGETEKISMMVTLHACDTATDYALAYGVLADVKVILSVPCCQHELLGQIKNDTLKPLLKHGVLKERFSSLLTDALRGSLLEAAGYRVSIMEFIDIEQTAKNIMIRAVKTGGGADFEKLRAYLCLAGAFSAKPTLYKLLSETVFEK